MEEEDNIFEDFDQKYFKSSHIRDGLLEQLQDYYANEYPRLCDVTLICNDKKPVRGHKLLLSLVSGFFKALFKQEPDKTEYEINHCDSEVMLWIVKAVCSASIESVPMDDLNLGEILKALDYFHMPAALKDVTRRCEKGIFESKDNIIEMLKMAEVINLPSKLQCIQHISDRIEEWHRERKLEELSLTTLKELFSEDTFNRFAMIRQRNVMDPMNLAKRSLNIIYEVLKSKNSLDCFQEIVTKNMRLKSEMDFLYFFATGDTSSFCTEFEYQDAVANLAIEDDDEWGRPTLTPVHDKYLPKTDDYILDPNSDLCQRIREFAKCPEVPFMWAGTFSSWYNLRTDESEDNDEWFIDSNKSILKIKLRFMSPSPPNFNGCSVIEGISVLFNDNTSQSINMDNNIHVNDQDFEMKPLDSLDSIEVEADDDDALVCIRITKLKFIKGDGYQYEDINLRTGPGQPADLEPKMNFMNCRIGCRSSITGIKGKFTQRNDKQVLSNLSFKIEFFTNLQGSTGLIFLDGYWPPN